MSKSQRDTWTTLWITMTHDPFSNFLMTSQRVETFGFAAHMAGLQDTHASCDFGHRCWQPYPKGTGSWNHLDLCGLFQTHTHRGFMFNNFVVLVVNRWGRRGWWLNMIIRKLPMCLVLFQATSRYFSDQTWSDFIHAWLSPVRLYLWWRKWLGTWWVSNLILQKITHALPLVWVST